MKNLFEHTSAPWIRYNSYEYKTDNNGNLYITVSKDAKPEMYHPMQEAEQLVIDAINIGLAAMHKATEEELKESVPGFVQKYGFLGFMTALPTTADFIAYESVYLPKNHFIKEESLSTEEYLSCFYPFAKPDFRKNGVESGWSVVDREGIAIDEDTRSLYRQGISAFGGITPTYRIALEKDAPVIVWDFQSLLVMAQMCFSFMLTDKNSNMRMCKHCKKAFIASRKGNEFCSPQCKNQFNVYKSREKKKNGR